MNVLKKIGLRLGLISRKILRFPRAVAIYARLRRQQSARNAFETERLDRIRNPWKYRGR